MSEFFFVMKTLIITVVLILCLQIRVGRMTLEQRSLQWMHESSAIEALRGVADGAVVFAEQGIDWGRGLYARTFDQGGSQKSHSNRHGRHRDSTKAEGDETD